MTGVYDVEKLFVGVDKGDVRWGWFHARLRHKLVLGFQLLEPKFGPSRLF
ncbi:hypothetical protein ES332_A07G125700v1 [Gossypium tomentosum]|uniref:Uncharacterized protein n=1 Tax=Gossypium tomentosum TaxID=34277 RepID=A0A5D2PS89_GOSTO|nr:hypothetical protein ES332_A07G125700v1 [Gossypium tomentosum]